MYCSSCGKLNRDGADRCVSCGGPLAAVSAQSTVIVQVSHLAFASLALSVSAIILQVSQLVIPSSGWGLHDLLLFGMPAIPALILGVLALRRIGRSSGLTRGKSLAIAGIFTSVVGLLIGSFFVSAFAMASARDAAKLYPGRENLQEVGLGIFMYREAHRGEYPPSLAALLGTGDYDWQQLLLDPADKTPTVIGPNGLKSSFEYVGSIPPSTPDAVIMAYSRRGIYKEGRSILSVDNAIRSVGEDALHDPAGDVRTSLRASYEAVVKAFGDKLTEERRAELKKFYEIEE